MGATQDLVQFITNITYNALPQNVINKAKLQILDCIGVTLAGSTHPFRNIVKSYLNTIGGAKQSTVIGLGLKAACPEASWANGCLGHVLDFDDNSIELPAAIHPTVSTLPAVLSVGEWLNASGKEMLLAFVVGIEVASKIDRAMGGHSRPWHGTGTFGTLASSAAAGKLFNLSRDELENALGAAMSMAAGLTANFGTLTKPLHAGQASRNGVTAALLAKEGLTSSKSLLEKPRGFADVMGDVFNPGYLANHLGNPWEIDDPGVHLKMYPSCMATHTALDAVLAIHRKHHLNPDEISCIEVRSQRDLSNALFYDQPGTALEGKFSLPFCIAVAIVMGRATLSEFVDANVRDLSIMKIMEKVKMRQDREIKGHGMWSTVVKVSMMDRRVFEKRVEYPKGSKMNPMTLKEIKAKFRSCAKRALVDNKIEELQNIIFTLDTREEITDLIKLFTK